MFSKIITWFKLQIRDIVDGPIVELTSVDDGDDILTFTYPSGRIEKYVGSGTVWYKLPTFDRAGTPKEFELVQYWKRLRYKGK